MGILYSCIQVCVNLTKKKSFKIFLGLLWLMILGMGNVGWGQVIIFSENMGTPTGTTTITTYSTGTAPATFQNSSPITFSGTADVRNNLNSTGYTGASGNGNIFITSTIGTNFLISGINTYSYSNLTITLGHNKSTTAGNNELTIEVSSDGITYTPLTYTRATGNGTANWILITPTGTIPSTNNLRIRFTQTSTTAQFRIDDVVLTGCNAPTITFPATDTKTLGSGNYTLSATSNSSGAFTYSSSAPAVASISGNTVTLNSVGTTTITASQAANGIYCQATATQTLTVNGSPLSVSYANIQSPTSGNIFVGNTFNVYAQAFMMGVTESAGQGAGLSGWIGYSTTDNDPSSAGWTWLPATFNVQSGNNDEFVADIGTSLPVGTYYYASRFQYYSGPFKYGAVGGIWDGSTSKNAKLIVNPYLVDFCNLQFPGSATIGQGSSLTVYAQVFKSGVTEAAGQGSNILGWIGTSNSNTDPSGLGWTWTAATFNTQSGNNDEYKANIGSALGTGTYYYASRFQYNSGPYSYGGYTSGGGGFWGGSNISGVLTIVKPVITITNGAFNGNFGSLCVGSNSSQSSYSVSGSNLSGNITITAPSGFQIKTGAGGWGTSITLIPTAGSVSATTIDVRFSPGSAGAFNSNISHNSNFATTINQSVTGTGVAQSTPLVSISPNPAGVICQGNSVTFTASTSNLGGGTAGYQWNLNGAAILGQTGINYTSTTLNNNDKITCTITVTGGCVTTTSATSAQIIMVVNTPPAITMQPSSTTVTSPSAATFTVVTTGTITGYQWQYYNGTAFVNLSNVAPYSGVNTATLTISPTNIALDDNEYQCVIVGPCGNVTSNSAILSVDPGPCASETFTKPPFNISTSSYSNFNWNGDMFNNWTATQVRTDISLSGSAATISKDVTGKILSPLIPGGCGILTFNYERAFASALNAKVSVNGTLVGTISGSPTGVQTFSAPVNMNGNVQISIQQVNGNSGQITIDDLAWSCYNVCTSPAIISSFLPASGPGGTRVTINGTGFTGATAVKIGGISASSFTVINANTIIAQVASGTSIGKVVVTVSGCDALSSSDFSIIYENGNCGLTGSGSVVNDISISEVYDSKVGSLAYIEVFNGTGATVALGSYVVRVKTGTSTNNDYALSGTLVSGGTYLIRLGSGTVCSGFSPNLDLPSAPGFNGNDRIYLRKGSVDIDYVPNPNYGGSATPGFSQARKAITTAITIPSTTYTASDWTISNTENCSNLGVAPYKVGGSTVTITSHPADNGCTTTITLNVTASSNPSPPTYVWKFNDPASMSIWDNVSIINASPYNYPVTVSGTGTTTVTITGNTAILQNFQFYVEVKAPGSPQCIQASNAAQYNYNSYPLYQSFQNGPWNDVNTWKMSNDNGGTWIPVCNYPIAINSAKVFINNDVTLPINVDANNVVINSGKILEIGNMGKLTMNNGIAGADFIVNGTLYDRGSSGNGVAYNTGATWILDVAGTVIKTNTSSAANYRDNYEGGIATIPVTASWYYRYNGDGNVTVVAANMYYPKLYFENTNNAGLADFNAILSSLNGSSLMVVKGDLNIGTTGTGSVKIHNNILGANYVTINKNLFIGTSSILTNEDVQSNTNYGTGFDVKGNITNTGALVVNSGNKGTLKMSGSSSQTISGAGNFYLYDVNIAGSANTVLTTTINEIDHQLNLTIGNLDVQSSGIINMNNGSTIAATGGDFANSASWGKIIFKGGAGAFSGTINFYPDVYITPPSPLGGVNFGPTSILHHLLEINSNGYVDVNSPSFPSGSLLRYNTGGNYDRSVEWSNPAGNGFPYNVQISGNTALNPARAVAPSFAAIPFNTGGDVIIDAGSSIYLDNGGINMTVPLIVGGNLLINGNISGSQVFGGDIKVNGDWTRSSTGNFYPNNRAVFFTGSGASFITAPQKETFDYLFLEKSNPSIDLSLGDSIVITQQFGIAKGTLTLNSKDVTLKSDNNATASMNAMDANAILNYNGSGRFIVERFIPNHSKAWQFLAIPTKGSTIKQAWQEGNATLVNSKPGYGTTISSDLLPDPTPLGFDMPSFSPSMKTYNSATDNFTGISNTTSLIDNRAGYFLFVRGDRSVTGVGQPATSTILRTRGKIYAPTPAGEAPTPITVNPNSYTSVGNPYASSIDFYGLTRTGFSTATYYIFDPQLTTSGYSAYGYGGYRTISFNTSVPSSGNYVDGTIPPIQSGQAFFVDNPGAVAGSISFTETAKVNGSRSIFRAPLRDGDFTDPDAQLRGNLYVHHNNEYILIDGELTQFQPSYNPGLDGLDARKLMNTAENMGMTSNNTTLAIERRPIPLVTDTLFYQLSNMKQKPYRFEFIATKMDISGLEGYVYDQFLKTETMLNMNDTTNIDFNVTGDVRSSVTNRFMIYFKPAAGPLPVTFTNVNAHLQNKDVIVEWKTENEKDMNGYTLQTSLDGANFKSLAFIKAGNNGVGKYAYTDADVVPGYHYYRVQSVDANGRTALSRIVKVWVGSGKHLITIYPNPIRNNEVNLQFEGQVEGVYKARLLNSGGQVLVAREINFAGGNGNETIQLDQYTAHGVYHLEITQPDGKKVALKVMK